MYYSQGIKFEDLTILLRIYKKQEKTLSEVLHLFSQPNSLAMIEMQYEKLLPITIQEALRLDNAEQRMVALRNFSPEELITQINAELIDSQTIEKKQIRWDKDLQPYEYCYKDTYSLYKVAASALGIEERSWWRSLDIYFVKCQCASTDRLYYLYVPAEAAEAKDAITAIAWTMQIEGKPINKEQYLSFMYSET
ncbi:MAG: hypothetical protein EAZ55_12570 [Cytophagales bacterium]|nr:MAG: hypothetical protein EAZ55_12570 [Cytophagales bacterium]